MPDLPQHLLGGLEVAFIVAEGCDTEQLQAAKASLEELGVNVLVVGLTLGGADGLRPDGSKACIAVSQPLSAIDPDSFDGVLVMAGLKGAERLAFSSVAIAFLTRMDADGKPIGAVSEGVLPLLRAGIGSTLSAPERLGGQTTSAGAANASAPLTVDENVVSLREGSLESFNSALRKLLARRRLSSIDIGNDIPSAVGEDG